MSSENEQAKSDLNKAVYVIAIIANTHGSLQTIGETLTKKQQEKYGEAIELVGELLEECANEAIAEAIDVGIDRHELVAGLEKSKQETLDKLKSVQDGK